MTHFIGGAWQDGQGEAFTSDNPATGDVIWKGKACSDAQIDAVVKAARTAFESWSDLSYGDRKAYVEKFRDLLTEKQTELTEWIAKETGKARWDSAAEVAAMIGKIAVSDKAYNERTGVHEAEAAGVKTILRHRPHGVMAVYGPYNFPAHLPNGHIIPALLAGNTVIFKPSEQTPMVGEFMVRLWEDAGLPKGVINLVQGERATGIALAAHDGIDGVLFTGSSATGKALHKQFAGKTGKMLALELGGNNALIVHDAEDVKAAAFTIIQSAFMTSGQRCSCTRRLVLIENTHTSALLDTLIAMTRNLTIGAYTDTPEPYMGPLISNKEAQRILDAQEMYIKNGGKPLLKMERVHQERPFLSPGIVDVTSVQNLPDEEWFGPLLQVIRVQDLNEAINVANATSFGLTAGILSKEISIYEHCARKLHTGVVNWNKPTTGASSGLPFGGVGSSGNHHPSAYYAADYCAYPVASTVSFDLALPDKLPPGIKI